MKILHRSIIEKFPATETELINSYLELTAFVKEHIENRSKQGQIKKTEQSFDKKNFSLQGWN